MCEVEKKMSEKYKIIGILKGIETKTGEAVKGPWKRMSIKIEKDDKLVTVSTFDEGDQTDALKANGKNIEVQYTKSTKGEIEYKNMIKGTLKILGDAPTEGEPLGDVKEEKVEDDVKEESVKNEPPTQPYIVDTQRLIVRQSSWDKANKYIENLLKAVELKVKDVKVDKKDLEIKSMILLAHMIEEDVMRR